MIKAGLALLKTDDGFTVKEKVCIELSEGAISSLGTWASCTGPREVVGGEWLAVLPQPANGHIHSGDFAFPEFGVELSLEDAVAPPRGLKHRLLASLKFEELVESIRRLYTLAWEKGVGLLVDFREGGGVGCRAARLALEGIRGMKVLILGRPGPEWPSHCDGLGISSPIDYDVDALKAAVASSPSPLMATHIAETVKARQLGDLERALEAGFKVIVHGTHLSRGDFEVVRNRGVGLVLCPRSNMWHGLGIPRIDEAYRAGVKVGLGSDNAAWFTPDPWEEARMLIYLGRLLGLKKEAAVMAADALFESGYAIFGERPRVIGEGSPAGLVLATVPDAVPTAMDKLYALLKRLESKHLIARVDGEKLNLIARLDSTPYQALHQSASSDS